MPMFVWFVMRDSAGSLWQSGVYRQDGRREAGPVEVRLGRRAAEPCQREGDGQGRHQEPRAHRLPALVLCEQPDRGPGRADLANDARREARRRLAVAANLAIDCTVAYRVTGLTVAKGKTYTVKVDANTSDTANAQRTITIVGA